MKKIKIVISILMMVLLIGCTKNEDTKGNFMKVMLETDLSEDYTWTYSVSDYNIVDIKNIDYLSQEDDSTLKSDVEVLTFKALSEGETDILIEYTSNQTGESKYDLSYILIVDADKNITISDKSGNYNKEIPDPIIFTNSDDVVEE